MQKLGKRPLGVTWDERPTTPSRLDGEPAFGTAVGPSARRAPFLFIHDGHHPEAMTGLRPLLKYWSYPQVRLLDTRGQGMGRKAVRSFALGYLPRPLQGRKPAPRRAFKHPLCPAQKMWDMLSLKIGGEFASGSAKIFLHLRHGLANVLRAVTHSDDIC
jgi:hypothetical protein